MPRAHPNYQNGGAPAKGVVITTADEVSVRDFAAPLNKSLGAVVGGYIELVHPQGLQPPYCMIVNEEGLLKDLPPTEPIFAKGKVYNSTANSVLARHCRNVGVPVISVHGLRHTHASLLLFAGVSIASVSRRLGHASMTTTQETYLHVIRELENKDVDIVMRALSTLI